MELESVFLEAGAHPDVSAGVCAMEMVAFLAGEPHSDRPQCTCPVLAAFVRRLNDRFDDAQRQCLKVYLPRLIGTAGDRGVRLRRSCMAADWACREFVPAILDRRGEVADAAVLRSLAPVVDEGTARGASLALRRVRDRLYATAGAAAAAYYAADTADAAAAAYAAAYAAAAYAADTADTAAAYYAADAAYAADAYYAADAAADAWIPSALGLLDRMIAAGPCPF